MSNNTLDTYALLTTDEAKDCLELADDFDALDTLIQFINGVSEVIERYTGREFLSRARTEYIDGNGTNYYILQHGLNTTAVSAICFRNYGEANYNETADAVAAASIKYNGATGEVYLLNGYAFAKGFQNCFITYTAGLSSVPISIKLAAKMILKKFWRSDDAQTQTIASMSVEGQTVTFRVEELPAEAKAILDGWRVPRFA